MRETLITTEEEQTELLDADAPCTAELAECTLAPSSASATTTTNRREALRTLGK